MDINDLQNKWERMNARLSYLEEKINHIQIDKMKSAKDKLANDYRRFALIGMFFAFSTPLMLVKFTGLWLSLAFSAYFLIVMIMDWDLYRRTQAIDVSTMSVAEVAHRAMENRKHHHLYQLILIPCVLLILGWMFMKLMPTDPYFVWGCGVGAVIGLAIGLRSYRKMMACYRQMT